MVPAGPVPSDRRRDASRCARPLARSGRRADIRPSSAASREPITTRGHTMDFVLLLGRVLFSLLFITSGVGHFTHRVPMAGYAKSMGAPAPELTVPLTGAMILVGGLMVLLGFYARVGALLIFLFLVPAAFIM